MLAKSRFFRVFCPKIRNERFNAILYKQFVKMFDELICKNLFVRIHALNLYFIINFAEKDRP